MSWLIASFISALVFLPLLVKLGYYYGFFPLFCQRVSVFAPLTCTQLPFQIWGFWIWISFGLIAAFVFIKSWFARLFILSIFASTILNISDKTEFFNKGFFATFIFFLFLAALKEIRWRRHLFYLIILGSIIYSTWAVSQHYGYWWPLSQMPNSNTVGGFFDNSNSLGAFLAISMPLFLLLPKYAKILVIFPLIGLWFASSTMGLMSFIGSGIFLSFKMLKLKLIIISILVLFILGALYIGVNDKLSASHLFRLRVWAASAAMAIEKPVLGWGFGSFFFMFDNRNPQLQDGEGRRWASPHNEYLQVWFEQGLFGLMLVLSYCIYLMRLMWRSTGRRIYYAASMLALMVNALGFFPMRVPLIATTAAIILEGLEYGDTQKL